MDEKTLLLLEFPKVLARLAGYCAFSASHDLALELRPAGSLEDARHRLALTSEARRLLSVNSEVGVGAAHDIRPLAERAARGGVLDPSELLSIKDTLSAARGLARTFEKSGAGSPALASIAQDFPRLSAS